MKQFIITPAMGKRLIGKALAAHPAVRHAAENATLVIVAGTTNGYVAEELLVSLGQGKDFSREGFRRGVVVPPGRTAPAYELAGDVVFTGGQYQPGKTIFDVAGTLHQGDMVLKGGNAVNLQQDRAAVLIGHPEAGTAGAILPTVFGRRVQLVVPIGLEKRVTDGIDELCDICNAVDAEGPRLLPLPGEPFTELNAIESLTGASAVLLAGGGVHGAEGSCWIGVEGEDDEVAAAAELIESVAAEPACTA